MKRPLVALLLFLASPASALDLVERAQIPERRGEPGKPVYVASLAPYRLPVFQVFPIGGGGGSSSLTGGSTSITNCGDGYVLFDTPTTHVLGCDADFTYVSDVLTIAAGGSAGRLVVGTLTTAGRGTVALKETATNAGDSSMWDFTSTAPSETAANNHVGMNIHYGSGNSDADHAIMPLYVELTTGAAATAGKKHVATFINSNNASPTGTAFLGSCSSATAIGTSTVTQGVCAASTSNDNKWIGVHGRAGSGGGVTHVGVLGEGFTGTSSHIGVWGQTVTGASTQQWGGLFTLDHASTFPTMTGDAALRADNGSAAENIFIWSDNGATPANTGAYAGGRMQDGGQPQNGLGVLTSATMTPETAGELRSVVSSYTWANADVVALGAGTTGDITVATLPAKTRVKNAYVVITGAAAGPATVTVSCGDAIAGTPFINYIVASDAKAAANTVYGDAVAERGTSIDVEFYYLPSYTATTLVTCHFISTGANLNTVTGSSGRVILETQLVP